MSRPGYGDQDPDRVSFIVDPSMYEGRNAFPGGVYGSLEQVVRSDLYYHYSTPICAQRWLDVCEDPVYGHGKMISRLEKAIPDMVSALKADRPGASRIRLTSLGPGDGSVDEHLLRGLDRQFEVDSYCGLDFSFDLLRRAAHRLSQAEGFRNSFSMRMICGDFTDLNGSPEVCSTTADSQLFSLTGFTLGNYAEAELMRSIWSLMKEGDYFLVDARLHDQGEMGGEGPLGLRGKDGLSGQYDLDSVRRFVFGPVEVATTATADEVSIRFEVSRSLTTVPNALNLVIFCEDLETSLRLSGERVRRDRLDLAVTTKYHLPDLLPWFALMGFSTVWSETFGDVAFFLLKCRTPTCP